MPLRNVIDIRPRSGITNSTPRRNGRRRDSSGLADPAHYRNPLFAFLQAPITSAFEWVTIGGSQPSLGSSQACGADRPGGIVCPPRQRLSAIGISGSTRATFSTGMAIVRE
jgi:hypothetical protein